MQISVFLEGSQAEEVKKHFFYKRGVFKSAQPYSQAGKTNLHYESITKKTRNRNS